MADTWGDVEKRESKDFEAWEAPPDGPVPARICALLDVGTHDAQDPQGAPTERRCVIIGFELGEQDSKGRPFFMSKLDTLSLHMKANLHAYVKALHGEVVVGDKFRPDWLAGKACLLQLSHSTSVKNNKERTYANIDSLGRLPKGMVAPAGGCIVWRVADLATAPPPDLSFLPPTWNNIARQMWTPIEWAKASKEARSIAGTPTQAGDARLARPNGAAPSIPASRRAAAPVTQAEADDDTDVPF